MTRFNQGPNDAHILVVTDVLVVTRILYSVS